MQSIKQTIRHSPIARNKLAKTAYWKSVALLRRTGIMAPVSPLEAGLVAYRQTSAWDLDLKSCPCDLQLVEYLRDRQIEDQSIFHFGTGIHHIVGLENQKLTAPNEIIGITASHPEHESYVKLVLQNRGFERYYKVLFCDIYALSDRSLPNFDIVSLFHLCEFYLSDQAAFSHHDDASLLNMFLQKLRPNGCIIFYDKSNDWPQTQTIIEAAVSSGKIKLREIYKNLRIYERS
jgi:SAM-dependent methyltransferase